MFAEPNHIGKTAIILLPSWSPLIPPLGITTVAQIFRLNGIDCQEFDFNIELHDILEKKYSVFNRDHPHFWDSVFASEFWLNADFTSLPEGEEIKNWLKSKLLQLIGAGFSTFGFSVFETNKNVTRYAVSLLHSLKRDCMIILGGPGINSIIEYHVPEQWLKDVNYLFYHEVEESLPAFIQRFSDKKYHRNVPGTASLKRISPFSKQYAWHILKKIFLRDKSGNYYLHFIPHSQKVRPEKIPPLHLNFLDLKKYKSGGIPIEFSRGCTGACSFCSETVRYRPYRPRPVEDLIRDIKFAIKNYNAQYFCLICSALNGNPSHLKEFCHAIIKEKIRIQWGGNARPDASLDREMLELMAKAGCHDLDFGLESGSDHVLQLMNKKTSIATASEIIRNCHKLGISIAINLIVGFPGETEEDFGETIRFIENHFRMVEIFNVSKCYVDGQAPLGKYPEKFNLLRSGKKVLAVDPDHSQRDTMPAIIANGPHWSDWCTTSGDNTPYIRNQRYQRVLDTLDTMGKRGNTPHDARKSNDLTQYQ